MVGKIFRSCYLWLILIFLYAPVVLLVVYSFNASNEIGSWSNEWNFSLYAMLFTDEKILDCIKTTLLLALSASAISTLLGTIGAIGMFYSKPRVFKILNTVTQVPIVNAEIVTAISLALVCSILLFPRTYASLLIAHVVLTFPFVVTSVLPKLKQMDPNLYEAGLDLGASPLKALFTIVVPEIMPGIASGFMLAVTLSLDDYIITNFTKPSTIDTISTYAYNAYAKNSANTSIPALRALSAIIFAVIIISVVVANVKADRRAKQRGNN